MKRQLTSILLYSAILVGGGSTFVSCTDHESDAAYNAQGSIADELNRQANALQEQINALKIILNGGGGTSGVVGRIDSLKNDVEANKDAIASANADVSSLKDRMSDAESSIREVQDSIDNMGQALALIILQQTQALKSQIEACGNNCKAYTDSQIAGMKLITGRLDSISSVHDLKIADLYTKYSEIDAKVKRDSILLDQVKTGVSDLQTAVGELSTKLDSKVDTADFNSVKAKVDEALAQSQANKEAIDSINAKFADYVTKTDFNKTISDLEKAYKEADQKLADDITALEEKLDKQLNELFNAMVNMITGIELQATESPISGYENLSCLGLEAHILGSYYGYAKDGKVTFLNGETVIGGNNELLIDSESGENAGVVYATINPSNKDFTGITLKVVDSQGNESPFTATVEKSDRVLKYGVTRAGKSNLYAVKINLDKSKLNAAKTWTADDATALKDAAKNVLDKLRKPGSTRLNLKQIGSTIVDVFNNRLTAYALQAEQNDTVNGKVETRFITSRMNLAATALKPLSYNFLKDNEKIENLDLPRIPTLQSKFNFADYKFNWTPIEGLEDIKTSVTLKDMPDISTIKINGTVPTPTVDGKGFVINGKEVHGVADADGNVTVDLSKIEIGTTITIGNIDVSGLGITYNKKDQTYDVTIPMDDFNKIVDNINSQVGNMISKLDSIVDKVKGYAETIDGKYITRINNFIQRFENLLRKSNSLLQPALFYTTSTGAWNQLSREGRVPSYMKLDGGKASTIFIASSYNGEILCPAYKRCISVTSKPEGATVSGENLGKTVGTETRKIGFEANKPGVYELTYEAVDFSGVYVSKKFYVKVVE